VGRPNTTTNTTTNSTKNTSNTSRNAAIAPSMSSYSQDLCIVGLSGSVQVTGFGVAAGSYITDAKLRKDEII
jgi:hypothetical protein